MDELRCVTIRNISSEERKAIETAKRETGHKQASRAIMAATKSFERMTIILKNIQEENNRLRKENRKLKICLSQYANVAKEVNSILEGGMRLENNNEPTKE